MIGSENAEPSACGEGFSPPLAASNKKPRFSIGKYQQLKKERVNAEIQKLLDTDAQILELKRQLASERVKIDALGTKLHNKQEIVRRRKRKITELEAIANENECPIQAKKPRKPHVSSKVQNDCSEKLEHLSRFQLLRRKKKTVAALRPIHCGSNMSVSDDQSVQDGLWTTLIGTASKQVMETYITNSAVCMNDIIPKIVKRRVQEYEKSEQNQLRSMRVLYEGGMVSKRKYTNIRNSGDVMKQSPDQSGKNKKSQFMQSCEIPKILPYKTLMSYIRNIDLGEVLPLEILAEKLSTESVPGVYRPLKPFLLRLADMYLTLHEKDPCLQWFNGEEGVLYVAVGADGAPFGKDDTATAYLVSFLNLLQRVQSCNDNHLILGANCEEDHALMKSYTNHLREEMEEVEGKQLTTERGKQVVFKFELIPSDMKWMSSHSGELNNCATYFSPFANVNQTSKRTIGGTIGGLEATWQPWDYKKRLVMAERVVKLKSKLRDPMGKQRNEVTKFIAQNKSRQEFVPPLGKVEVSIEQVENLKVLCQQFFNANSLLLTDVTPTVWTVGVAIPYHTSKLHQKLGYGLGLNSMQGREAKHVKLAKYVENTCNARKSLRWWTVFRHEFVSMVWLREKDPYSIAYRCEKRNISDSYIPKRVRDCDDRFCHCGLSKKTTGDQGCEICTSDVMKAIKQTVASGKITPELSQFYEN
ncbi:unnamed protein product [Porites evermanni]|uniref:Uncharacterized protein n=1 Tax=Porites evermanni TaxID=104178 RepID=A0ABN8SRC5_9CNID|nr:unnamed protein product [Porites evermanni]